MVIGVIPARLESTRFPRKILFPIRNKPMIMHVYERALRSKKIDRLIIAADSFETVNALKEFDVEVMMTSALHQSGTDRIAEAMVITGNDLRNSNSVKVTVDNNQNAEGFYRNITDYSNKYYRHVGIYGYRKDALEMFTKLEQSKNEKILHLEQLRALDNGIPIRVVMCNFPYRGIDIQEDLEQLNL
jgi:3-deoxy-manno-octulosonate cytidylyltransferase (CMP-KDO synthetase)